MNTCTLGRALGRPRAIRYASRNHGLASMMAMLFLMLFSTLAVGFFTATSMDAKVASNDSKVVQARDAADGGMRFMRYQLGQISIPAVLPSGLMDALAAQLGNQLNGAASMKGYTVQNTGGTIYIPAQNQWMTLDSSTGSKFRATVTQSGTSLLVTVTGGTNSATITRAIQLQFQSVPLSGNIFNYGIASASEITMGGNVKVTGSPSTAGTVLSATAGSVPLTLNGSPSISGDYSYVNTLGVNVYGTGTIAGYNSLSPNFSQHVHSGVASPVFPVVDPSVYSQYATNPYMSGSTVLSNVTLPPGTYSLSNVTIQGVLYLQSPCKLSISGQSVIQGVIVTDCKSNVGNLTNNVISLSGQVQVQDTSSLPTTFPAGERALTGAFILAPYYAVNMSGNFGTISGSMIASQYALSGNASATIAGSMINIADTSMDFSGNASVTVVHNTAVVPAGVYAGNKYNPLQGTYVELTAQ